MRERENIRAARHTRPTRRPGRELEAFEERIDQLAAQFVADLAESGRMTPDDLLADYMSSFAAALSERLPLADERKTRQLISLINDLV